METDRNIATYEATTTTYTFIESTISALIHETSSYVTDPTTQPDETTENTDLITDEEITTNKTSTLTIVTSPKTNPTFSLPITSSTEPTELTESTTTTTTTTSTTRTTTTTTPTTTTTTTTTTSQTSYIIQKRFYLIDIMLEILNLNFIPEYRNLSSPAAVTFKNTFFSIVKMFK